LRQRIRGAPDPTTKAALLSRRPTPLVRPALEDRELDSAAHNVRTILGVRGLCPLALVRAPSPPVRLIVEAEGLKRRLLEQADSTHPPPHISSRRLAVDVAKTPCSAGIPIVVG
jgi:hypothetical protein